MQSFLDHYHSSSHSMKMFTSWSDFCPTIMSYHHGQYLSKPKSQDAWTFSISKTFTHILCILSTNFHSQTLNQSSHSLGSLMPPLTVYLLLNYFTHTHSLALTRYTVYLSFCHLLSLVSLHMNDLNYYQPTLLIPGCSVGLVMQKSKTKIILQTIFS